MLPSVIIKTVWPFVFCFVMFPRISDGAGSKAGGKAATKVGLAAGMATVGSSSTGGYQVNSYESSATGSYGNGSTVNFNRPVERLKYDILVKGGYDKAVRPVKSHRSFVNVDVDFTTRQVLDLDEKNQVLKSYVYFRLYWNDDFLKWNPEDYDNISSVWLLSSVVWRPDIVIYEDTGNRDYSPRIPYVEVSFDGRVRYLEPTVFETSCSVNIANFPFDYQICTLTFTSWTFPTSKVDVSARRSEEKMMEDIDGYFIKTGEWVLHELHSNKESQSFGSVLSDEAAADKNTSGSNETKDSTASMRFLYMTATKKVIDVAPDRMTDLHWSAVKYTFKLRRNSSLYMQSMLFPAVLLTTIALLGFYLPPDSGERIGLQITILLTYMVFLLTVGEMFPASSGPYLGMYYVICMGLLGVNLAMTVVVLHMHYMPVDAVIEETRGPNGETFAKQPPAWIRFLVFLAKRSVKSDCCKTDGDSKSHDGPESCITPKVHSTNNDMQINLPSKVNVDQKTCKNGGVNNYTVNGDMSDECSTKSSDKSYSFSGTQTYDEVQICPERLKRSASEKDTLSLSKLEKLPVSKEFSRAVANICKYLKEDNDDLRERILMGGIESQWKAMARVVDNICLKTYLFLLVVCHVGILIAALSNQPKEPVIHQEYDQS